MRRSGALVAEVLALLRARIAPGVTTGELDRIAHEHIAGRGGIPSFLNYPGPAGAFPGSICASLNETIVHGIPGSHTLREGDIISLDVGAILDGWHGDAAMTVPVGQVDDAALALIRDTEEALAVGIEAARAGGRLSDVSVAVARVARRHGWGIVPGVTGHGIGRQMHEPPTVPNYVIPGTGGGPILRPGMTFTIEPMFTAGSPEIEELADGWTLVTRDRSLASHAEHTIVIAARGPAIILTSAEN